MSEHSEEQPNDSWPIPPHWEWATMEQVSSIVGGGTPSTKDEDNFGGTIPWITPADLSGYRSKTIARGSRNITAKGLERSGATLLPADTVLFSSRAPIGYVAITSNAVTTNQGFKSFIPEEGIISDYLYYYLQHARDLIRGFASGTTFPEISGAKARLIPVPVPPTGEQRRIVPEIEIQLTRLDAAIGSLQRVQANMKRYRAAVLKAACEGRLVPTEAKLARAEGRGYITAEKFLKEILEEFSPKRTEARRSGKSKLSEKPTLPHLPEGWSWATWSQIGSSQNGRAFPSAEYSSEGVKLLRPGNLSAAGSLSWTSENTRCLPESWASSYPEFLIGKNELVMNLTAQSLRDEFLGRVCLSGHEERCLLNQRLARLTPHRVSSRYILWVFKSPWFRKFVDELNTGSLIQHMFTWQLDSFPIPLPPPAEQERIVTEIERRFSIIESIDAALHFQVARSQFLRSSILQRAFEGRLVPQHPNDEPASVLLERIRQAKASQASEPRARKVRTKPVLDSPPPSPPPPVHAEEPSTVAEPEPEPQEADFLELSRDEQVDLAWELLLGQGPLDKDSAIRTVADGLRDRNLARFKRLRQDGPLYGAIAAAIEKGVREGDFDRPRRGCIRAVLTDPKDYTDEVWQRCLLAVIGDEPAEIEDTLRAAAEWARETMGLEFARLREDGVILTDLREALEEAVRAGRIVRRGGRVRRPSGPTGRETPARG